MGYCVASGGNLLWVMVWRVVVIFMGYWVAIDGNYSQNFRDKISVPF